MNNLPRLYTEDGFHGYSLCDETAWMECEEIAREIGWCKLITEGIKVTMEVQE